MRLAIRHAPLGVLVGLLAPAGLLVYAAKQRGRNVVVANGPFLPDARPMRKAS